MGRPRSEVPAVGLVLFRAASRRTGLDGFPIIRLSSGYCVSEAVDDCLVRVSPPPLRWLGILTAGDLALQVPAAFGLAHARVVPIAGGQGRPA